MFLIRLLFISVACCCVHAALSQSEVDALVDLYTSTNGASWDDNTNWNDGGDPCMWFGVTCDGAPETVTMIKLINNGLVGTLPSSLSALTKLKELHVHQNTISGSIPDLSNLKKLRVLYVNSNELTGGIPDSLTECTTLSVFDGSQNALGGAIPENIGNLGNLTSFACVACELTTIIPASIVNCQKLRSLNLRENYEVTGELPVGFFELPDLRLVNFEYCSITGLLPDMGNLASFTTAFLFGNNFLGFAPNWRPPPKIEVWNLAGNYNFMGEVPDFSNCTNLREIRFNYIAGLTSSRDFLYELVDLPLTKLQFPDCVGIVSHFPPQLGNISTLGRLVFRNTGIYGVLPEFVSAHLFDDVDFAECNLYGPMPQSILDLELDTVFSGTHFSCDPDPSSVVPNCSPCPPLNDNPDNLYPYYNITNTGYIGVDCDRPCLNGGWNHDGNTEQCDCSGLSYIGPDCNTKCQNGATVIDGDDKFVQCDCTGLNCIGARCQTNCNNGFANHNWTECDCSGSGATGKACNKDVDDCGSSPCANGGVCFDNGADLFPNHANEFNCSCEGTGYHGIVCEISDCISSPCLNNGRCEQTYDLNGPIGIHCNCSYTSFEGDLCQTEIDECASSPCVNDGACVDSLGDFACICDGTGYEGLTCSDNVDDCLSSPCRNDGTCQDKGINTFKCTCDEFWDGDTCSDDVDDCILKGYYCENGAGCADDPVNMGDVLCDCSTSEGGFTGKYCDVPIEDACVKFNPCANGGKCILDEITKEMSCDCTDTGYEGDVCDVQVYVSECVSSPCLNEGQCYDPSDYEDDWYCVCVNGYFGELCDFRACDSNPCQNGGTCTNDDDAYTCSCLENYSGSRCQVNEDEQAQAGSSSSPIIGSEDNGEDVQADGATDKKNLLVIVIILAGVIAALAIGYFFYQKKSKSMRSYSMPT